jgi:hypothetical protein
MLSEGTRMRAFLLIVAIFLSAVVSADTASGQGADRTTKVANQLIDLINAGDYAGIQTSFNKEMGTALPLDKSTAFFKSMTQQLGKFRSSVTRSALTGG